MPVRDDEDDDPDADKDLEYAPPPVDPDCRRTRIRTSRSPCRRVRGSHPTWSRRVARAA
ncbi:hypothetical protein ACIBSW_27550 [Actinoplanes sp. NPDC049668]|uniref:hypothetical protein n=1 Tax=unclassified Actinoplanes TaxID=2626549 RepID=UPI0033A092CF